LGDSYDGAVTLRRRLTFLVALAVVIPITAVGVTVANLIGGELERRTFDRLQQAADFARADLAARRDLIDREVATLATTRVPLLVDLPSADRREALRVILTDEDLDFVVLADADGLPVASARRAPQFSRGVEVPDDGALVADPETAPVLASQADVSEPAAPGATVTGGIWLDDNRLGGVFRATDVDYLLVDDEQMLASTAAGSTAPSEVEGGAFRARIGGEHNFVVGTQVPGSGANLLAHADPPENLRGNLGLILALLLVVVVVLIVLVGHVVAGLITAPVQELVEAANAVSRGDLDQHVGGKGDVEIAALGAAFNRMTENLRDHVRQLEQSRTEFRSALDQLGDVLVSTHDLDGIIAVVLETAQLMLHAETAVFYDRVAMPARIRTAASHGAGSEVGAFELNATGVAGTAARNVAPVVYPGNVNLDPSEPEVDAAIAVPVRADNRLSGVLAVYGRAPGGTFTPDDAETLATLARQTEVAIGNVTLHEEAQRQARTDGLTGLWNRREFEMRSREHIPAAARFNEPFGVIIVDADDFKDVNDLYDHLTGDAALVWIASRLSEATRPYDVVARWGGEEFTVLLPRTGPEETALVAERIRSLVAGESLVHDGDTIHLTVSVGYSCYPDDGRSADDLFRVADAALLRAKRLGKNRVERAGAGDTVHDATGGEVSGYDGGRDQHASDQGSDPGGGAGDEVPAGDQGGAEGDAAGGRQAGDPVRGGGGRPSGPA
jgi:diguanylate cyclase (GGDEF)-like protein